VLRYSSDEPNGLGVTGPLDGFKTKSICAMQDIKCELVKRVAIRPSQSPTGSLVTVSGIKCIVRISSHQDI
jgi:hypothetical protein